MGVPLKLYYEDFTLFMEVDPNGDVTITARKVDVNTMRINAGAYTWRWYGAGYFDDFEHRIDATLTAADVLGLVSLWMVSNNLGTAISVFNHELGAILVRWWRDEEGVYKLVLSEYHQGPVYTSHRYTCALGTTYYLTITRSGSTCTCKIYSNPKRTHLLDTLTVNLTGTSDGTFSFVQTAASQEHTDLVPASITHYAENLCREDEPWPEENIPCISLSEDFNDNSVNPYCWEVIETGEAYVVVKNQRLECTGGGDGDDAGVVSVVKHELSGHSIKVDVLNDSRFGQDLVICLTKNVGEHPWYEDEWYRIIKYNSTNMCYVQRKVGGGAVSTLYSGAWSGPGGSLKIVISGGTIYFYEEDTLRASEAYGLASTEVYIYLVSSSRIVLTGMDYFDNIVFT